MEWWKLVLVACHMLRALCNDDHGLQGQCGMENMQIIVPQHLKGSAKVKVLNKHGKMELLRNDPSCGIWVTQKHDGSVIIGTSYDGCFVTQTDAEFVLTLGLATKKDGKKVTIKKEMTCAVDTYHDSPLPDQCDAVVRQNRLNCRSTPDSCANVGCCYDPSDPITSCYFGNKVTARCTPDGLFSIAIPRTLTKPDLDLTSVKLLESSSTECNPIDRNDFFLLYLFPVSSCGTTFKVIGDQAVYENQLLATKTLLTWNRISITRDSTFRLLVRCSFAISGLLPLKVDVVTLPPPPPVSSVGPLAFELRISIDSEYSDYYKDSDYPVVKVLRDPVYVEVRILQRRDPNLVLVLHQCWATPSPNPVDAIQWPILVNGCPFTSDNYMSERIPVSPESSEDLPSHYFRFNVMTFTFVDQRTQESLAGQVYLHCSVSACVPSPGDNCATCSRRKRSAPMLGNETETVLVSSPVPIYFENSPPEAQNDQEDIYAIRVSHSETLINGAAAVMGILAVVLLTLMTWTLHRQRKSKSVMISRSPSVKERNVHIRTISAAMS
ncbi:zona pellucida sperm-binding protein 4-like [Engystomops pustulosus]|uniref:zona pellucida sperm-binding protein 4-like n=1 Tax=Engystomops pustulosus TaxID=76066 RepID=UPI003AFAEE83